MTYDLIVIGGGPAGMMAAGRAGERGARVLLLERNKRLGVKLSITGKGRCNITNAELSKQNLVEKYGSAGKFLMSAFSRFDNNAVIDFFNQHGLPTKVERGNRVFPLNDKSGDVLNALDSYLRKSHVAIRANTKVKALVVEKNIITKVLLAGGEELTAKNYALCTGGKSYPLTGSDGAAYEWLAKIGHTIVTPRPALVPLVVAEKWVSELEGLSLKNVTATVYQNNKKVDSRFGEALFTGDGLSGPIILDLSRVIGAILPARNATQSVTGGPDGGVEVAFDFKSALDFAELDRRLQKDFSLVSGKMFKNSLEWLLPKTLIPVMIRASEINPEKKVNAITKEERKRLVHLLKDWRLTVKSLAGYERAIVTAGGVELKEVDPKTLRSKVIDNLFLAGEILNIDGPTGGFNLQACWSTGFALGDSL